MKIITYLDWSDIMCECGAELSGRYASDSDWDDFIKKHKHCSENKIIRHYDPKDSLKVFTDVPKRECVE